MGRSSRSLKRREEGVLMSRRETTVELKTGRDLRSKDEETPVKICLDRRLFFPFNVS